MFLKYLFSRHFKEVNCFFLYINGFLAQKGKLLKNDVIKKATPVVRENSEQFLSTNSSAIYQRRIIS